MQGRRNQSVNQQETDSGQSDFLEKKLLGEQDYQQEQQEIKKNNSFIYVTGIICSIVNVLLGYDIGIYGIANVTITRKYSLTTFEEGLLVATVNFLAAFGCFVSGPIADHLGRKKAMILAAILFIIGTIICVASFGFVQLLIGRIVLGFAVGVGQVTSPLLLCEITPPDIRGKLVGYTEVMNNVGITLGFLIGYLCDFMDDDDWSWRIMLGIGIIPPIVILALIPLISESPRWLIMKGFDQKAKEVLIKFNPADEIDEIVEDIKSQSALEQTSTYKEILINPPGYLKRILVIGMGVPIISQMTGTESAIYYTPKILEQSGVTELRMQEFLNIFVGLSKTLVLIFPMLTVDSLGRKPLLLMSIFSQGVTAAFLGASLDYLKEYNGWIPVIALFLYLSSFSMGLSTLAFVIPSEVFPLKYRGKCFGMAWFFNRLCSGIVSFVYPVLSEAIEPGNVFFIYAGISFIGGLFFFYKLPETKEKPLEDVVNLFRSKVGSIMSLRKGSTRRLPEEFDAYNVSNRKKSDKNTAQYDQDH